MPCNHKFQQYLNLELIDFEPSTLIVGTFNPEWPEGNQAEWFYGRTNNNYLWDVLPRLYNPDLNLRNGDPENWKQFCSDNAIALTDIIFSINDADENNEEHIEILGNYLDAAIADYFQEFAFTNLVGILEGNPTIENVYLTRQDGIELFDDQWNLIVQYGNNNPNRNLRFRKLLTPSASARFQIAPYRQAHPNDPTPLRNFIYEKWHHEWH